MKTLLSLLLFVCGCLTVSAAIAEKELPFDGNADHFLNGNREFVPVVAASTDLSSLRVSDQLSFTNPNLAIGPNAVLTNMVFGGNDTHPFSDIGFSSGTGNIDAMAGRERSMTLTGNATIGITNWPDGVFVNLTITNTGSFTVTITNVAYYKQTGNATQPAVEQGSGIINTYYFSKSGTRPMGSLEGRSLGFVRLPILTCTLATNAPARFSTNSSTGMVRLLFATNETCYFQFTMPQDYGSTPTLRIPYSTTSATSGTASFSVSVWSQFPGDAADASTESYDTANVGTDTVPGVANRPDVIVMTLTTVDSMVAGSTVALKITSNSNSSLNDLVVRGDFVLEYVKR